MARAKDGPFLYFADFQSLGRIPVLVPVNSQVFIPDPTAPHPPPIVVLGDEQVSFDTGQCRHVHRAGIARQYPLTGREPFPGLLESAFNLFNRQTALRNALNRPQLRDGRPK